MATSAPPPDLDAEQEVDFGRYWRLIAQRWWLPVIGLVAGLVVGYLVSLGTHSSSYKATALVYLGQPLAPDGAAPVSSAPTTLGLVSNLVASAATVREVADKSGLKPGRLSGHITTKPVLGITAAKVGTPAPLLAITVTGSPPRKIADAANRLAAVAVDSVSGYSRREDREAEGADRLRRPVDRPEQRPLCDRPAAAAGDPRGQVALADREAPLAREHQHHARHRRAAARPARDRPAVRAAVPLARPERREGGHPLAGRRGQDRGGEQPHRCRGRRPDRPRSSGSSRRSSGSRSSAAAASEV